MVLNIRSTNICLYRVHGNCLDHWTRQICYKIRERGKREGAAGRGMGIEKEGREGRRRGKEEG